MTGARPRVVSVTPVSADRDSRTLKIAASFAVWGWESQIVEGHASVKLPSDLPLAVTAVRPAGKGAAGQAVVGRMGRIFRSTNPLVSFPLACAFGLRFLRRHRWQVGRRIPEADLYYLHSFEDFGAVQRVAQRCGAKIIYDAHDFYSGIIPRADMPPYRRTFIQPLLEKLEERCIAEADAVVTVGEGVADLIAARFRRRPTVLRNAHDQRLDTVPAIGLRKRLGIGPGDLVLVTVGNRKIGQAVTEAVASLALLPPEVHLVLIGAGYDSALSDAVEAGVEGRVHVVPPVSPTEIVPLITEADIGLVLYWDYSDNFRNALPNGFFQVVAAGLPLIHGRLPEITRVSDAVGTGLGVDLLDPRELAAAVKRWMRNPVVLDIERDKARHAAGELTWVREEATLSALLEGIAMELEPGGSRRRLGTRD